METNPTTGARFRAGVRRLVGAFSSRDSSREFGDKSPNEKAMTSHHTPRSIPDVLHRLWPQSFGKLREIEALECDGFSRTVFDSLRAASISSAAIEIASRERIACCSFLALAR